MESTLQKFEQLIKQVESSVSKRDFIDFYELIAKLVVESRKQNNLKISKLLADFEQFQEAVKAGNSTHLATLTERISKRLAELKDGARGPQGNTGPTGAQGPAGKDGSPDMAEDIRNKLELLLGDERLKASAISGLDEVLRPIHDRIGKVASARIQTPAKAFMVHLKDLSAQCNGANKTFNVGGTHFGIIGVYSTQFPIHYRPLIDYTITKTGFVLTDQVAAPETGQTLTAQFLK